MPSKRAACKWPFVVCYVYIGVVYKYINAVIARNEAIPAEKSDPLPACAEIASYLANDVVNILSST
jgi:hypothetical protein